MLAHEIRLSESLPDAGPVALRDVLSDQRADLLAVG